MATFFSGVTIGWWYTTTNYMKATLTGDVTRSGNTVTLSNMVLSITAAGGGSGSDSYWFTVNGVQTPFTIRPSGTNFGSYNLYNTSLTVGATQSSATVSWSSKDGYTGSFVISCPVAPSTPTVTIAEIYPTGAKFNVSVASYGAPPDTAGRYLKAAISRDNNYWIPFRAEAAYNTSSASITVDNNSSEANPSTFTISPNTQYYYTCFAYNTVLESGSSQGTLVTTASAATVSLNGVTGNSATFDYSTTADGGYHTKTIEYSIDGGTTWTTGATVSGGSATSGQFTVSGLSGGTNYTLLSRVTTASGSTTNLPVNFTTVSVGTIYCSVNNQTKRVKKLYCSVNNQTKEIVKVYGSVNGVTKRIY